MLGEPSARSAGGLAGRSSAVAAAGLERGAPAVPTTRRAERVHRRPSSRLWPRPRLRYDAGLSNKSLNVLASDPPASFTSAAPLPPSKLFLMVAAPTA